MKIAGFAQERSCCTTLRIRHPLEKIRSLGLCESYVIGLMDPNTEKATREADVVILGRTASETTLDLARRVKGWGGKVAYDLDDNMFDVSPLSPHYKDFGTMPVEFDGESGKKEWLWKDGVAGFNVRENRARRKIFLELIRTVDCITVTTPPLEKLYRRFNDNVVVIPNSVDFTVWEKPPIRWERDEIRLLYTGASNHQEDWLFVSPVLAELQKKYDKLKIVLIGTDWKNIHNALDYSRVEVHGWVDYEAYPYLMKALCPDIGIAPISKTAFNDCRSSLKWVEYSALRCATVASEWGPYSRDIEDGVTGLLVKERDEWTKALTLLIEDSEYRRKIALRAYGHCKQNYDLNYVVDEWVDTFKSVKGGN